MSIDKKINDRVKQLDYSLKEKVLQYINSLAKSKGIELKVDVLELKDIAAEISRIAAAYGIIKAGIFGSYARGEASSESDIDLLLEFNGVIGLMRLGHLKSDLEETFGKKIDILQFCAINPLIRDHVLQEVIIIYDQGHSPSEIHL